MDPLQAFYDILDALYEDDKESAAAIAENLQEWIDKGGYVPAIPKKHFDYLFKAWLSRVIALPRN